MMDDDNDDINEQIDYEAEFIHIDNEHDDDDVLLPTISTEIHPHTSTLSPSKAKSLKSYITNSSTISHDDVDVNLSSSMNFQGILPHIIESELINSSFMLPEEVSDISSYFEKSSSSSTSSSSSYNNKKSTHIRIQTNTGEEVLSYSPEEIIALETKVISLQHEVKRLHDELQVSEAAKVNISIQDKKYENIIEKYQKEANEAIDEVAKHEAIIISLSEKIKEYDAMKKDMIIIEKERDDMEKKWDKTRNDLESCKAELNKVKMESSRMKVDYDAMQQKHQEEKSKAEQDVDKKRSTLEQRVKESEAEILRLDEQNRVLQKEVQDRSHNLLKSNDELSILDRRVAQLEAENLSLRRSVADVDMLETELHQLRRRNAMIEADVADLSNENTQLRKQIQAMKADMMNNSYTSSRRSPYDHMVDDNIPPPPIRSYPTSSLISAAASSRAALSSSRYSDYHYDNNNRYMDDASMAPTTTATPNKSSGSTSSSTVKSLASLVGSRTDNPSYSYQQQPQQSSKQSSTSNRSSMGSGVPFATEQSAEQMTYYDGLDRQLTTLTAEKTSLLEEAERLHQRGGKTLKDRTRLTQVEHRLDVLGRDIGTLRKTLATKPS